MTARGVVEPARYHESVGDALGRIATARSSSFVDGELMEETPSGCNILRAGQAYWRPARGKHNVKNTGASTARVFAIQFDAAQRISRQSRAITMVVHALSSFGISRAVAWRMVRPRCSPRMIGQ